MLKLTSGIFFYIILFDIVVFVKSFVGLRPQHHPIYHHIKSTRVFDNSGGVLSPSSSTTEEFSQETTVLRQIALLISLWQNIAFPPPSEQDDNHVDFKLTDFGLSRNTVRGVLSHFQTCKDCAADNAMLIATQDETNDDILRLLATNFPLLSEEDDESWTDYSNLGELEGEEGMGTQAEDDEVSNKPVFPIEGDDSIVLAHTQDWVRKVICDLGVCPFTVSVNRAGIPLGGVRYTVSRAKGVDEAFLRFWEDVAALLVSSEKEMSTVLLVFPEIELFGNFELFEAYCDW